MLGKNLLDLTLKTQCIKGKIDKMDFIKIKNLCNTLLRGRNDKLHIGKNTCKTPEKKDHYVKYIMNSQNSTVGEES